MYKRQVFYLLVVRRYRLSPLLVLPVIWLGGLVSLQFAAPGKPSLLAPLGLCAVGVELGIAAVSYTHLVRISNRMCNTRIRNTCYHIRLDGSFVTFCQRCV